MLASEARAIARRWVEGAGSHLPGFAGAFYHGSIVWLADDAPLSPHSDVDIMVVLDGDAPPLKLGKFRQRGALLEVSYLPAAQLASPDTVLAMSHLAGSFHKPSVIADPTGRLTALNVAVARDYPKRRWVAARCAQVEERILAFLGGPGEAAPWHAQVTSWLFGTGNTAHLLLVAGLRNPTVRSRYPAVRQLLIEYGQQAFYPDLLALLDPAGMGQERATQHLTALAAAFDAASAAIATPVFFASDLSAAARPIAIDGSRELIARGDQREAIFWLVATYARCLHVLHQDAPSLRERHDDGFRDLLGDLGIASPADLRRRAADVRACLPALWRVADAFMDANPDIAP